MLADSYIPKLSNDMKMTVQKNNLEVKFCTEVWTVLKKWRQSRQNLPIIYEKQQSNIWKKISPPKTL